jgi:hypothetical protein
VPATSFSSVDFPAPLAPSTHQRSLRRSWKSSPVDRLAAIALVNVPEARHVIARARRAAEFELDGLAAPRRFHPSILSSFFTRLWTCAA